MTCSLLIADVVSRPLMDLRVSVTGGVHFDLVKRVLRDIKRSGQAPEEIIQQVSNNVPILHLSCCNQKISQGAVGTIWEVQSCSMLGTGEDFWSQEALSLQVPVEDCTVD